jgi:allantoin racemase
MRTLVVNVNTAASMTDAIRTRAERAAAPGTEIVALTPFVGPEAVEGNFESYLAAVAVMDRVLAHDGAYDAVVQAGFGEQGREGLQELLDVPVVDVTEAAAHVACLLGHRYSVVTTLDRAVPQLDEEVAAATGVPVVDGVAAAVALAESLVRLGLTTSKVRTYARPRPKTITGWPLSARPE